MATIYTTKVVYKTVSSQTIYSFGFDYLNKTFVKVKLNGQDLAYLQDYTVDEKTINLTTQPTQGVDLEIYRSTSTEQEVQWEDSSVFRANTLNLFQTQLLHLSQEALDGIREASLKQDEVTSKWDAEGIQINNVGDPQESKDAVNLGYLSNLQDGYITQVEALITNAKNVAEADHMEYLNRFMSLLASTKGQADRAESEATRAYNEANRAEGYAEKALQISRGDLDFITDTEADLKVSLHNTDETAHQPIIDMINSNQTEVNNTIEIHNTSTTSHQPILDMINTNQTALTGTDNQIKSVLNTLLGTGAWDTPATKNIANIINLLGVGGIVAQRLENNGYIKFANGLTIQWGQTSNSNTKFASKATFPISFNTVFTATGTLSQFTGANAATAANIDDLVQLTLVGIAFQYYAHNYIAIGLT